MRPQGIRALYYSSDGIDEILVGDRGDASHVSVAHPSANGNLESLSFALDYTHAFENRQDTYPLNRYQPTKPREQDLARFQANTPDESLAIVTERGDVYRNELIDREHVEFDEIIAHAKEYFSRDYTLESVA